jgi:hypothetical protein
LENILGDGIYRYENYRGQEKAYALLNVDFITYILGLLFYVLFASASSFSDF